MNNKQLTNTIHSEISGELVEPEKSATTSHQLPDENERFHEAESRGNACINNVVSRPNTQQLEEFLIKETKDLSL